MRRRIWWHIRVLDIRTSENLGSDQEVLQQQHFDTKAPLNINDDDLVPSSVEAPMARTGITEMSPLLIRYEIITVISRLTLQPSNGEVRITTVQQIDRITDECRAKLEDRFLKHCNMEIPWHWLIVIFTRIMLARMWVNVHHRFKIAGLAGPGGALNQQGRDRLFPTSIEIVESCLLLERNESTKQWKFCSHNYIPWQAMAFILSELCARDRDEEADRAWVAVQGAFDEWADVARNPRHDLLWSRMRKLFEKVRRLRLRVTSSNEVGRAKMATSHGISAESTITPTENNPHPNASEPNLTRNDEMGFSIDEFRSSVQDVGTRAGSEWQRREGNQLANIGPDAFGQFDLDFEMDFLPTAGPAEISNGDFFEELDNWW
jgi:hypothetical protein